MFVSHLNTHSGCFRWNGLTVDSDIFRIAINNQYQATYKKKAVHPEYIDEKQDEQEKRME